MTTRNTLFAGMAGALLTLTGMTATAHAAFTCEAVARRGDADPTGDLFTNRFDEQVAINEDGDTLFIGRAGANPQTLYLYEHGGPRSIIARLGDVAPGGSAFTRFSTRTFGRLGLNTQGDAVFLAKLALPGEGIFVRVGGIIQKAAQTTDVSPAGGTFVSFPTVSDLRDSGEVYFVGVVDGGPSGIFRYDAATDTREALIDTTHTDESGHPFCTFQQVGLSDGLGAFTATVGIPDCATPVQGVFRVVGPGVSQTIARAGDPSPIGGAAFEAFLQAPETGASTVTFAAHVTGVPFTGDAVFQWDGVNLMTVAAVGDAAPDVGGLLGRLGGQHRQTLGGEVVARFFTERTTAGRGIFVFGPSPVAALVKSDSPPGPPAFGGLASFRTLGPPAIDETGTFLGLYAQVKDSFQPRAKNAILRCVP